MFTQLISKACGSLRSTKCFSVVHYVLCTFLVVVLFHASASAQGRFTASAPKTVAENQNFNLTYTLENANGSNLKLPAFTDFTLIGGPSTSTSMQIINGRVTQSASYTYVLRPKAQGTFTIAPATIDVGGATVESNSVTITVTAPSSQPQSQQNSRGQSGGQPQTNAELQKQLKDDVFVRVSLSKTSVYKGQLLTATFRLYFRQNLTGFNLNKAPLLDGFWSKEVDLDPNRKQTVEVINGRQFYAIDILKYNLYPQRAGTLQIGSAEINTAAQVVVRSQSNDPFDDFFNDPFFNMGRTQNVPLTLRTDPVSVNVKELPAEGRPADFAGAVGKFSFSTSLSGNEAKTDDPVTYTMKITGEGNLNLIDAPSLHLPSGFEVYDPKVKENISAGAGGMSGSKQFDYLIIPRLPGEFTIGGQPFSYFDPSTGKYVTIPSPDFRLKITGEPSKNANTNASSSYTAQQNVSVLGEDIRYIKTGTPSLSVNARPFFGSAGFIALYVMPFLAFIGLIAVRRRNESLEADIMGAKRRRALRLAKKRLQVAEKHLKQNQRKNFYDELSRAVWGYLSDKLNIDLAMLSKENVEAKLIGRGVSGETVAKMQQLLSACELSLYSPSADAGEMQKDYTSALNIIADLEDEIKRK